MGFLCAVDLLINNSNRVPVLGSFRGTGWSLGNPKNLNFEISNNDGLLTDEQVRNPSRRLAFENLVILNSKIHTIDRLLGSDESEAYTNYTAEVETLLANCCVHLRVPSPHPGHHDCQSRASANQ